MYSNVRFQVWKSENWFSACFTHMGAKKKLVARISKSEPLILKSKPLIFSLLQRGCFFTRFSGAEFLHGFLHEKIFSCKEPDFFNPNRSSGFVKAGREYRWRQKCVSWRRARTWRYYLISLMTVLGLMSGIRLCIYAHTAVGSDFACPAAVCF